MNRDSIDLANVRVALLFRKLFFPTLMGMLSMSAVAAIDGMFVGRGVGSDGIAAVNLCIPLLMFFMGIGLMVGVGSSVVASIHLSRGRMKVARMNIAQALIFITVVTSIPVALMLCFPTVTAKILGTSSQLEPMVTDYLIGFLPGLLFQLWGAVSLFIIRLDGAPRYAMWCNLVPALLNIILDWWFIFPLDWGVFGAALASSVSVGVGGLMAVGYLFFKARNLRIRFPKWSRKSWLLSLRNIGYQCRIGLSALLGEATLAVLMFAGNLTFMRYMGDSGVGAFGVACYYIPFVFMVGNAIAQSAQPIISYNYGASLWKRVEDTRRISVSTAVLCGSIVMLAFILFPKGLVSLFLDSSEPAYEMAVEGFPLFASGFIFFVFNLAVIGYYQSLEKVIPSTIFALLRGFIFLVPAYIFLPRILGNSGIWLAMPVSELLTTGVILFVAYRYPLFRRL